MLASAARALLVGALLVGTGVACGEGAPAGTEAIEELSEVGDCLRPDPDRPDGFLQASCDDPEANVEIVEMVADPEASTPACPAGTDSLVDGRQGPVVDGDIAGQPSTWCLRNLEGPHPGDPGRGGGELVEGDCFAAGTGGSIDEAPCEGGGRPEYRLLATVPDAVECPPEATDPIELTDLVNPQVLCATGL